MLQGIDKRKKHTKGKNTEGMPVTRNIQKVKIQKERLLPKTDKRKKHRRRYCYKE